MLGKKNADTKMSTLIGAGAELTGDFTLDGSARIDGKIGGNVTVTGNLILGAGSIVTGDVQAASVLIGGEVTGNITAPEKAELTASAKVLGDIATKVIVIDEHAVFQGKIDMNQTVPDRKGKARTAKAVRAGRKCQGSHRRSSEGSGRGRKERKSEDFTDSRDGGEDRNSSCGNNSSQYKRSIRRIKDKIKTGAPFLSAPVFIH